jgi:hypothetical protein
VSWKLLLSLTAFNLLPPPWGVVSLEGGKTGQGGVKSDLKSANPA